MDRMEYKLEEIVQADTNKKFLLKTPQGLTKTWMLLNNDPTSNCQLALVKLGVVLFTPAYFPIFITPFLKSLIKPLFLIDIRATAIKDVKALIGEEAILMESPYKSTSSSNMAILIKENKKIK